MSRLLPRFAITLALVAPGLVVGACAATPAAAPPVAAEGGASIVATARLTPAAPRRLQKLVSGWTAADVALVELRLFSVAAAVETELAAIEVPASALAAPATFSRLRANTLYRLKARAYRSGGRTPDYQISDDAASLLEVATTSEDRPTWAAVPVQLGDVPFAAEATSPGVLITDGELVESLRGLAFTIAGSADGWLDEDGPLAQFSSPTGLTLGGPGGLLVADTGNHRIRVVDANGGVTTLAGDGTAGFVDGEGGIARFDAPSDLATNGEGPVFVSDTGNHALREVDPWTGAVTTVAGGTGADFLDDPDGLSAKFNSPKGFDVDGPDLYVADSGNNRIRLVSGGQGYPVSTIAGGAAAAWVDAPLGVNARFNAPSDVAMYWPYIYVADTGNHRIRRIDLSSQDFAVTTIAGDGTPGYLDGEGLAARFNAPQGLELSGDGRLYVADTGNHRIRVIDLADPLFTVTPFVGGATAGTSDGLGAQGRFNAPAGLLFDYDGSLIVADSGNHRIRRVR